MLVYRSATNLIYNASYLPTSVLSIDTSNGLWICNNLISKYSTDFISYEVDVANRFYMVIIDNGEVKLRRKAFDHISEIRHYHNFFELIEILNDIQTNEWAT